MIKEFECLKFVGVSLIDITINPKNLVKLSNLFKHTFSFLGLTFNYFKITWFQVTSGQNQWQASGMMINTVTATIHTCVSTELTCTEIFRLVWN